MILLSEQWHDLQCSYWQVRSFCTCGDEEMPAIQIAKDVKRPRCPMCKNKPESEFCIYCGTLPPKTQ